MWALLIIALLIVLVWITRLREGFIDKPQVPDPKELIGTIRTMMGSIGSKNISKDPPELLQKIGGLLDKYERPENLGHVMNVKDKDPGQLARMYLNINNG